MNLFEQWEVAGGSVPGTRHIEKGINNQDAWSYYHDNDILVACVSDGCGSQPGSEVGSRLLTDWIVTDLSSWGKDIHKTAHNFSNIPFQYWEATISTINRRVKNMFHDYGKWGITLQVMEKMLATLVGVIISKELIEVFYCGDGLAIVGCEAFILHPNEGNRPDYLMYQFLDPESKVKIHSMPFDPKDINHILIGTDGAVDLMNSSDKFSPGAQERMGPISQFWERDIFFKNPDAVRRRLWAAQAAKKLIKWDSQEVIMQPGILSDDTTIISIRKKVAPKV